MILEDVFKIKLDVPIPCLICGQEMFETSLSLTNKKVECLHCDDHNSIFLVAHNFKEFKKVNYLSIQVPSFRMRIGTVLYSIGSYGAGDMFEAYLTERTQSIIDKDIGSFTEDWMKALVVFQ